MKYIPSIAFEEMSGSAKGVSAAKTRGRKYIRREVHLRTRAGSGNCRRPPPGRMCISASGQRHHPRLQQGGSNRRTLRCRSRRDQHQGRLGVQERRSYRSCAPKVFMKYFFVNTKIAVLSLLRCRKLKCIDREPPYGSEVEREAANEQ